MAPMAIGSLFSGIGGLELGLDRSGLGRVIWQVEFDPFCRAVLAKHWPDVDRSVTDVRAASATVLPRVDILCGGFPCHDVSAAGKGAGLAGDRSGLWYEFRRIVDEIKPRVVIVENVASGAKRWVCAVRTDLRELGYRTTALGISAADVGAPHRRQRIFVAALADAHGNGREGERGRRIFDVERAAPRPDAHRCDGSRMGDPHRARLQVGQGERSDAREEFSSAIRTGRSSGQPGVGGDAHGLSVGLDRHRWPSGRGENQAAWEEPRTIAGRTHNRAARLRALGNAVVPACAEVVGRFVLQQLRS